MILTDSIAVTGRCSMSAGSEIHARCSQPSVDVDAMMDEVGDRTDGAG